MLTGRQLWFLQMMSPHASIGLQADPFRICTHSIFSFPSFHERIEEGGKRKCGQYWPLEKDFQIGYGTLTVTNLGTENLNHYKKTLLEMFSCENRERRRVTHFQYVSWPDYGVPSSAATLIDFLGAVKQQQRVAVSALGPRYKGHPGGPPIVVHCSAGIGR
ncbi:PREDICTED: tyrosine-protein phosphatase non-receptor type 9-like, partial [Thamnophis sirtalis]|uniref:protein-tyrosine-phosphatase n=1 Tax=Thamnophis sirtalis TaxID=35019 RepID=A0A6I9Y7J7_9SAUR